MACLDCFIAKNRPELRSQGLVEFSTISNGSTTRCSMDFGEGVFSAEPVLRQQEGGAYPSSAQLGLQA